MVGERKKRDGESGGKRQREREREEEMIEERREGEKNDRVRGQEITLELTSQTSQN